jgi:alpha-N-acetylglucosaminidase
MNNLEGWGGPNPDSWYTQQEALQKRILRRMREYGMEPVFPGYSGMVPHDAREKLGLDVAESGLWNGFTRPAFLQPTDPRFAEIAHLYYKEKEALFGKANYYSMDPFHESELTAGVDFDAAGQAVMKAMKAVNPEAVWVVQGWTENPRPAMVEHLSQGDLLILDLFSECRPMWGIPSIWQREEGYGEHNWLFCMLENFGANVGLHGRMDQLLHQFYETRTHPLAAHLKGIGLTMEGIENNPVMFELMTELPWRAEPVTKEAWIRQYVKARYGTDDAQLLSAWTLLAQTLYNCPAGNNQQGPHESIFCGRPTLSNFQASSWSKMQNYYNPASSAEAARRMLAVADRYRGQNHFEYDLVDVVRQAVADRARREYQYAVADFKTFHREGFDRHARRFLRMLTLQDSLLATRSEFRVGRWIQQARSLGVAQDEKDLYEWNARVQITTWGNRTCADDGGLRDYAHKEWSGLLRDFYRPRWEAFFDQLRKELDGAPTQALDYYAMEEPWTLAHNPYSAEPEGDCVDVARAVFEEVMNPENDF